MNTYMIKKLSDLDFDWIKTEVVEFLSETPDNKFISIRCQTVEDGDNGYQDLYGCYSMTSDEVDNYYSSGGIWDYIPKSEFTN